MPAPLAACELRTTDDLCEFLGRVKVLHALLVRQSQDHGFYPVQAFYNKMNVVHGSSKVGAEQCLYARREQGALPGPRHPAEITSTVKRVGLPPKRRAPDAQPCHSCRP